MEDASQVQLIESRPVPTCGFFMLLFAKPSI
jgi:hypothetical protein